MVAMASLALLLTFAVLPSCEKDPEGSSLGDYFDSNGNISADRLEYSTGGMTVSPTSIRVSREGDSATFQVTAGGNPPYTWHLGNSDNGSISPLEQTSVALYKTIRVRDNWILVKDQEGRSAMAAVYSTTSNGISLSPSSVNISRAGQTVSFSVSGGGRSPYSWSLADNAAGSITPSTATDQATYRATTVARNNVIVTDADGVTAVAEITRSVSSLSVTPNSALLNNNGDTATFTAVGGAGPFSWNVVYGAQGGVAPAIGNSTVYTRSAGGSTNSVILIDSDGNTVTATVAQPL
ncbi:MAG: hypothetical protein C0404_03615 [Verrucomicrobia bacterium]|nr:hypothetical protein [Verrucomicrobiota bacterium]